MAADEEFSSRVVTVQFGGVPLGSSESDFLQAIAFSACLHRCRDWRTEIWFAARHWLRDTGEIGSDIGTEVLEEIEADVLALRPPPESKGQLWMESKGVTRNRLGRSPDLGDALALSCVADLVEEVFICGFPTAISDWEPRRPRIGRAPMRDPFEGRTPDNWRRHGCERGADLPSVRRAAAGRDVVAITSTRGQRDAMHGARRAVPSARLARRVGEPAERSVAPLDSGGLNASDWPCASASPALASASAERAGV